MAIAQRARNGTQMCLPLHDGLKAKMMRSANRNTMTSQVVNYSWQHENLRPSHAAPQCDRRNGL